VISAPQPVTIICKSFDTHEVKAPKKSKKVRNGTVKIDVVADGGKQWIRVNTSVLPSFAMNSRTNVFIYRTKNSRLLAELREIDSYCTDSEDDFDVGRPSLAQTEFDNSLLRVGRTLVDAAAQQSSGGRTPPKVTLRLSRLEPTPSNPREHDPRIAQTIDILQVMGIEVLLGDRAPLKAPPAVVASTSTTGPTLAPSTNINLDLSILVALVSDLTHAPLPSNIEQAEAWFTPGQSYREWKDARVRAGKVKLPGYDDARAKGLVAQTNALAIQSIQEVRLGMLQEIHQRLDSAGILQTAQFWSTAEARNRCLRIVSKIGGPNERRRANALLDPNATAERIAEFWQDSRWPAELIPLLPIRILPLLDIAPASTSPVPSFTNILRDTCTDLLAEGPVPDPRSLDLASSSVPPSSSSFTTTTQNEPVDNGDEDGDPTSSDGEIERAAVIGSNVKLTAHTVQSMLQGSLRGWTTLTANKGSIRMILKEMRTRRAGLGAVVDEDPQSVGNSANLAAFWIVEPRSLAEGMRCDST
jgi:hypothetical protein